MIEFDSDGWAQARAKIHAMRQRAENLTPAWNELLDWWAHGNRQHFGTQGARWGTPWPELSPQYLADKRAAGYTGDVLVRESRLLRSLADRPLDVERILPGEVTAGTSVPYARHHQYGAPRARIPRRQLINAAAVVAEGAATEAVVSWIVDANPRTGGDIR